MKVIEAVKRVLNGGYRFRLDGRPEDRLVELELPARAVIPLGQTPGREARPVVKVGDEVRAGQVVGRGDRGVSPVHASIGGRVEAVTRLGETSALAIAGDGTAGWQPLGGHSRRWDQLPGEELETLLHASGVTALDGGVPTRFGTASLSSCEVENLIIEGVEDGPYPVSVLALLAGERREHFVEGIGILQKLMPRARLHLAVSSERPGLARELTAKLGSRGPVSLHALAPKYPQGHRTLLTRTILGNDARGRAAAAKTTILSVATVLHARDAVVEGKPLMERTVALCGPGWKENLHLQVRVGTPVEFIAQKYLKPGRNRLVVNCPLTSGSLADLSVPVDRTFSSLIAVPEHQDAELLSVKRLLTGKFECNTGLHGEGRPCVFCGYCEDACPVGIIPHLLDKRVKRNLIGQDLVTYGIFECVECNLCTFVCPSKIPVARHIKLGQRKLMEHRPKKLPDKNAAVQHRGGETA
ncbi:MAG: 4Fe-4S dicluster domain-containing protein [Bacillota bacterium]